VRDREFRSGTRRRPEEKGTEPQPRFLESVLKNLKEIGVPNARIKREFYG
jgi:hypothetical protein